MLSAALWVWSPKEAESLSGDKELPISPTPIFTLNSYQVYHQAMDPVDKWLIGSGC